MKSEDDIVLNMPVCAPFMVREVIAQDCYGCDPWMEKEKPCVVDLGANIGTFSLMAAKCGCDVLALEPHPEIYSALLKNIEANPDLKDHIAPWNVGVAPHDGTRVMRFTRRAGAKTGAVPYPGGDSCLDHPGVDPAWLSVDVECVQFEVVLERASALWKDARPWALKIDIEGAERELFSSLSLLTPFYRIVMEKHGDGMPYAEMLRECGYIVMETSSGPYSYIQANK